MDYKNIVVILFLLLFYLPIFSALIDTWTVDPYYSHGFIIPLISAYLVYLKRSSLKDSDADFMQGVIILAAGLGVYGFGIINKSLFLSATSLIIVLAGFVLAFYGRKILKELAFPILFLAFMIPIPGIEYLSTYLQGLTAQGSTLIIQAVGVKATLQGSQVTLSETNFEIGDPCSGLRTMLALFSLAAVFSYLMQGRIWQKTIVFLSAIPIAVIANIVRVALVLWIANSYGTQTAMKFFHELSSALVFLLAFILLIIISRCIGCIKRVNT